MHGRWGIAVLASAALTMGGCSLLPGSTPAYTHISEELTAALPKTEGFMGLEVYSNRFALLSVQESQPTYQVIFPNVGDAKKWGIEMATLDPGEVDPEQVQQQAQELAEACKTPSYVVSIAVISRSAMLGRAKCGKNEVAVPGAEPSQARINGEPIPTLTGAPDERFWSDVLSELRTLAPSGTIHSLVIDSDKMSVFLASADAIGECQPAVTRSRDGRDIKAACIQTNGGAFALSQLSGSLLAAATTAAAKDGGVVTADQYIIGVDAGQPYLSVSGGDHTGRVPLG